MALGRILSGYALFAKIKTIFRVRNSSFLDISTGNTLKYNLDYSAIRIKSVKH